MRSGSKGDLLLADSHVRAPCSWGGRMDENNSQKKQIGVVAG